MSQRNYQSGRAISKKLPKQPICFKKDTKAGDLYQKGQKTICFKEVAKAGEPSLRSRQSRRAVSKKFSNASRVEAVTEVSEPSPAGYESGHPIAKTIRAGESSPKSCERGRRREEVAKASKESGKASSKGYTNGRAVLKSYQSDQDFL
jgi:hypothetical protein